MQCSKNKCILKTADEVHPLLLKAPRKPNVFPSIVIVIRIVFSKSFEDVISGMSDIKFIGSL